MEIILFIVSVIFWVLVVDIAFQLAAAVWNTGASVWDWFQDTRHKRSVSNK